LLGGQQEGQLKQLRAGYLGPGTSRRPPRQAAVPLVVQTHNTVEDSRQRPTTEVGGVYSYEAIAPADEGEPVRLRTELRLRTGLAERLAGARPDWWRCLAGPARLGRSKKDDYGEAEIEVGEASPLKETPPPVPAGGELVVWLLSDTLLRDERLRPAPTLEALKGELERRLGVTLAGPPNALLRPRRIDSWHVGWGLPRPSLVALQAGSCAAFKVEKDVPAERLAEVQASGIGERTGEGYGQVCFNDSLLTTPPGEWAERGGEETKEAGAPLAPLPEADPAHAYARRIEREAWREEVRRRALAVAADRRLRQQTLRWDVQRDRPPMSQLGGLRDALALLRSPADAPRSLAWLDALEGNQRRRDKWPPGALAVVRRLLEDEQGVWEVLGGAETAVPWPTLTAGAERRLRAELWTLGVRALVDACVRAHKREREGIGEVASHGA
jgi:CRISPR-associated protein Csx10